MSNDSSETSASGKRQIHLPRRLPLVLFSGSPGAGGSVQFYVPVPDSRLHWQFSLLGVGDDNVPGKVLLASKGGKIWVAACEEDNLTGAAPTPVTDLIGQQSAPENFPRDQSGAYDTGLGGFSLENDGASCAGILGEVTFPAPGGGPPGQLVLQARYQPNVGHYFMPWEWEEIIAQCQPQVLSAVLKT